MAVGREIPAVPFTGGAQAIPAATFRDGEGRGKGGGDGGGGD